MILCSCTTGVYLSLKGKVYANNSVIPITEIGETDVSMLSLPQDSNNGLQCITDKVACCRHSPNTAGGWFFPNGTMVETAGSSFYRNRGHDDGTVNLNRLEEAMSPTGLFCCVVPDATDVSQTICAKIGEYIESDIFIYTCEFMTIANINLQLTTSGSSIAGEKYTLVCALSLVTGNETTKFQWLRPNMTSIIDANITMINSSVSQLEFDPLQASHEGSITCQVMFGGTSYMDKVSVSVNGEFNKLVTSCLF